MEATSENRSPGRLFSWIERVGNKVPNPFLLFVYLIVVLIMAEEPEQRRNRAGE